MELPERNGIQEIRDWLADPDKGKAGMAASAYVSILEMLVVQALGYLKNNEALLYGNDDDDIVVWWDTAYRIKESL